MYDERATGRSAHNKSLINRAIMAVFEFLKTCPNCSPLVAKMADSPTIVLIPHTRSHPFTQRECSCSEPLKVGRSVDKKRIFSNNLIFDCRVLSRNHALIWFENGKVRGSVYTY